MANDLGDGHYGGGQQGDSLSWAVALLGVGIVAGAYVDAWSRESRAHPMAPWQDVPLEVAWLGLTAVLASALVQNLRGGRTWSDAMPNGLMGCLVGCVVFAVGAIADGQLQHVFPAAVPGGHADLYSPGHILERPEAV